MEDLNSNIEWTSLDRDAKKHQLYLKQKELLDRFLGTGAISKAQYDKSLHDLTEKMGETDPAEQPEER